MNVQDHQFPQSQDFTLVSYPTLMSPNVASVKRNIQGVCNGTLGLILFSLNPINWATIYRNLQGQQKTENMLSLKYYSASPFRLGKPDQAVKYAAFPVTKETGTSNKEDKNFLRQRMKDELALKSIRYDFMIQFQEDAVKEPIETVCVEWKSPWHKVAEIEIPPQNFDTPELNTFGENLTFSPWHCHKDNKPLGGINRARQATYEAVGKFRVERNRK